MPPPWTGKANWKRRLRTKKPVEAKVAAVGCLAECTAGFRAAEQASRGEPASSSTMQQTLPPIPPADIEADILRELLADDEAERRDGDVRRQMQTPEM